jgi:hypothetical protein
MIRIVSVVRSTDLVVSSSWDDEYVTVPTPHSHAVLQDRVHFEEVASSGSAETRAEKSFNESLAVEVETRFGCTVPPSASLQLQLDRRLSCVRPQCEQAQHLLSPVVCWLACSYRAT